MVVSGYILVPRTYLSTRGELSLRICTILLMRRSVLSSSSSSWGGGLMVSGYILVPRTYLSTREESRIRTILLIILLMRRMTTNLCTLLVYYYYWIWRGNFLISLKFTSVDCLHYSQENQSISSQYSKYNQRQKNCNYCSIFIWPSHRLQKTFFISHVLIPNLTEEKLSVISV